MSIAIEFARAGADVAICQPQAEHLEPSRRRSATSAARPSRWRLDVRQEEQVKAIVERVTQDGDTSTSWSTTPAPRPRHRGHLDQRLNTVCRSTSTRVPRLQVAGRQMMRSPTRRHREHLVHRRVYGSTN